MVLLVILFSISILNIFCWLLHYKNNNNKEEEKILYYTFLNFFEAILKISVIFVISKSLLASYTEITEDDMLYLLVILAMPYIVFLIILQKSKIN